MKKLAFLLLLLVRSVSYSALPPEWYHLPENGGPQDSDSLSKRDTTDSFLGVKSILKQNLTALDNMDVYLGSQEPPPGAPPDWAPWHLSNLILDLAISAQGSVGALVAEGETALEVYWRRKAKVDRYVDEQESNQADLLITRASTTEEWKLKLEPIVKSAIATGKVENEELLRKNLVELASKFQGLMTGLEDQGSTDWKVSKFRLDVSVEMTGTVVAGFIAGAAIRLRFDWIPTSNKAVVTRKESSNEKQQRENLARLSRTLAEALEKIADDHFGNTSFKLTEVSIGVGIFSEVEFGVVEGSFGVTGYLFFKKTKKPQPHVARDTNPYLAFITEPSDNRLSYAKKRRIAYVRTAVGEKEAVVYQIPIQNVIKGLNKAAQMSVRYAHLAEEQEGKKWEIFKIEPEFALSISGTTGSVTLGGTVTLKMELEKQAKHWREL